MNDVLAALTVGVGATLVMDAWGLARARWFGVPSPDYGLVGRWIAHMAQGRFRHRSISASPAMPGERAIGWLAHYAIGIAFAALLLMLWGPGWLRNPTLVPALLIGIGTVVAPFLLMQPAMGAGFAASRAPRPALARLQSVITHTVFGFGLYLAGCLTRFLYGY